MQGLVIFYPSRKSRDRCFERSDGLSMALPQNRKAGWEIRTKVARAGLYPSQMWKSAAFREPFCEGGLLPALTQCWIMYFGYRQ